MTPRNRGVYRGPGVTISHVQSKKLDALWSARSDAYCGGGIHGTSVTRVVIDPTGNEPIRVERSFEYVHPTQHRFWRRSLAHVSMGTVKPANDTDEFHYAMQSQDLYRSIERYLSGLDNPTIGSCNPHPVPPHPWPGEARPLRAQNKEKV